MIIDTNSLKVRPINAEYIGLAGVNEDDTFTQKEVWLDKKQAQKMIVDLLDVIGELSAKAIRIESLAKQLKDTND